MRTIFEPINVKKGVLQSSLMKPNLKEKDEDDPRICSNKLSVTRFLYVGIEFCRRHARSHSNPGKQRKYWGFAKFKCSDLRQKQVIDGETFGCEVLAKPVSDNWAHANIQMPINEEYRAGVTAPPQFNKYVRHLCKICETIEDPEPDSETWKGKNVC